MIPSLMILLGYVLGSLSTAVIASRVLGLPDPRTQGSHNPGATNVLRLGGKKAALITLLGDMAKGLLAVLLARALGVGLVGAALVALAAFLGHLYPVFFGFRGGKGVATALGALLALSPWLGLALAVTWATVFALSRVSSLSALTTALLAPFYTWWLLRTPAVVAIVAAMCLLLIWRHRANIRNLLQGTEDKLGSGA